MADTTDTILTTTPTTQLVRTRFAPSPTGKMHIGNFRTALYCFLFTRKNKGTFILRIEDTDQKRFVEGALENIISVFEQAKLTYDEGVTLENGVIGEKGDYGSYMQSKRTNLYNEEVNKLIANGSAYYCFCTSERLEQMRNYQIQEKLAPRYDKLCSTLSKEEIEKNLAAKKEHVIRLRVPEAGSTEWKDVVRGNVRFEHINIDDQVLLKSDGFPTYHLANVVDDHHMKISHVIRGEDWLPSTPKHLLLYKAFGWNPPVFAHLPLLVNEQRKKLSKREGDLSVSSFLDKGYLIEAIVNFVAFLGWNPKSTKELFTLDELIAEFSLEKVNKAAAVLDIKKLNWINAHYIKQLSIAEFSTLAEPFLQKKGLATAAHTPKELANVYALEQQRVQKLEDVGEETGFYFQTELTYDTDLLKWKELSRADAAQSLTKAREIMDACSDSEWTAKTLETKFFDTIKSEQLNTGSILWPLRVALTGKQKSPGPFESAEILGKKRSLERIDQAIVQCNN